MPRKPKKEPGVFERSPGRWYCRFYDEFGKDVKKSAGSTKTAALELLAYYKEEVRKRKSPIEVSDKEKRVAKLTVPELLDRYLPEFEDQASYKDKKNYAAVWSKEFPSLPARDLTARDVILWQKEKKLLGMSAATVQRYTAFLRRVFNLALRDRLLNDNPLALGRVPAQKETGGRKRIISPAEEKRILPRMEPVDRAAFVISLYAGLRQGEVLKLRRDDIDFKNRLATLWATKAGKTQTVPLNSATLEALSFVMSQHDHDLLFLSVRDASKPLSGSRLTERLKAVCEELGYTDILWHTTRHTFLTRLANQGHGVNTVRDLGRHSSVRVTSGYMHTEHQANLEAVESICGGEGVLFPSAPANRGHLRALP